MQDEFRGQKKFGGIAACPNKICQLRRDGRLRRAAAGSLFESASACRG